MMIELLAVLLQAAAPAPSPATPAAPPAPALPHVALETSEGTIVIAVEDKRAPVTAGNFLRYVDGHRLDGAAFYRAVRPAPRFGFVQFGVQNDPKKQYPPIRHEPTTQTGLKHGDGAISLARLAPGTGQSEFTISVGDQPSLDAQPGAPGDNLGYAAFGRVVEGMDVVHRIQDAVTDPAKGTGVMKGQMIAQPVRILSAKRVPAPPPRPAAAPPPPPAPPPPLTAAELAAQRPAALAALNAELDQCLALPAPPPATGPRQELTVRLSVKPDGSLSGKPEQLGRKDLGGLKGADADALAARTMSEIAYCAPFRSNKALVELGAAAAVVTQVLVVPGD